MSQNQHISLSELQGLIKDRIGQLESWVKVEVESHRIVNGHHYLSLIEKAKDGHIAAKASARIWRSSEQIVTSFSQASGKNIEPGIELVVLAAVDYHAQYGLTLIIKDIDLSFAIGQRELEKRESIRLLSEAGLMETQKELALPYFPESIAVISSQDAAGWGDFVKHLDGNPYGYRFNCTLFHSLVQGENAPAAIMQCLREIESEGKYDVVMIMRGGGADSDMFCFDDYELCRAIAEFPLPVLTAIGHERDYHIADMVANAYFKTPTALADFLLEWAANVDKDLFDALSSLQTAMLARLNVAETELARTLSNIRYAVGTALNLLDSKLALLDAGIRASDPRSLLRQGYVLAVDRKGQILKNVHSAAAGDEFALRFSDGIWDCVINEIKIK